MADLFWHSLWMGNCWVADDKYSKLPWRHGDVIAKYPASKQIIDAVDKLPAVREVCDLMIGDGAPSATLVAQTGFFGMIQPELPGNARKFNFSASLHPNFVGSAPIEVKSTIDMPLTLE